MTYYQPNRGSGFPLQWLIALVIAVGAIIVYFNKTSINPTTGEKQRVSLTPDQETALGMQSAPQMISQMGGELPDSDPATREVQSVGNRVWKRSDAARSPYPYHYHLLADRKTINAFALPGGEVFITKGLLDRLTTEGELAGVLGHETGHVVERHVAQQMAQSDLGRYLVTAVGVGASNSNHPYADTVVASTINQMTQLHFSRHDESQADECGLRFMTQAGYDPHAMLKVMEVLQQVTNEQGGRPPEMLQTHPYPEQRMADINAWLAQNDPNNQYGKMADPPLPWARGR